MRWATIRARNVVMSAGALAFVSVAAWLLWPEEKGKDTIYNEETVAIMRRVMAPDANGVDVGAFEGTLTRPMVEIAPRGHHYAVEPQPAYAARLKQQFPNVEVCACAFADTDGTAPFVIAKEDPPRSGFHTQDYPTPNEHTDTVMVPVRRLDDVVASTTPIRLIKIDVEGAEYLVLLGARETIRRDRPYIAFEYGKAGMKSYGTTPEMMWTLVHNELGLDLALMRTWLDGGRPYTEAEFTATVRGGQEWMFVAFPAAMPGASGR